LGLKLGYLYALEPYPAHVELLKVVIKDLGVPSDIDTSLFDKEFQFDEKFGNPKFDLILFSHCLYAFADPCGAVAHAVQFLKPAGKILILNMGESGCSEMYSYLVHHSAPDIFSPRLTHVDHTLTAERIATFMRSRHPDLSVSLQIDTSHIDVDQFVRANDDTRDDDVITFFLQAEYRDLSEHARKEVHRIVMKHCDVVDGKYHIRHPCAAIIISLAGTHAYDELV
jgi:SAM-dependent methyltransferase